MAKNNKSDKVLDFLIKHPNEFVSRKEIEEYADTKPSTLTEILKKLRARGVQIETPPRSGQVRYIPSATLEVTGKDIFYWAIIFCLSKARRPLTFNDLVFMLNSLASESFPELLMTSGYSDSEKQALFEDSVYKKTVRQIRSGLNHLLANNYITRTRFYSESGSQYVYEINNSYPRIMLFDYDTLERFQDEYQLFNGAMTDSSHLKDIYKKVCNMIEGNEEDSSVQFGKLNKISSVQLGLLPILYKHNYKTRIVKLTYATADGSDRILYFATGILFYSPETNLFYLLGKDNNKDEILQLRLDHLQNIEPTDTPNQDYNSSEYQKIFKEIFQTSYTSDCHHVKVLFEDFRNIRKRLENLHKMRADSKLKLVEEPVPGLETYTYLYEDDIRGIEDFARYLRAFGYSALVLEPRILKDRMLESTEKVIQNYSFLQKEVSHE